MVIAANDDLYHFLHSLTHFHAVGGLEIDAGALVFADVLFVTAAVHVDPVVVVVVVVVVFVVGYDSDGLCVHPLSPLVPFHSLAFVLLVIPASGPGSALWSLLSLQLAVTHPAH